MTDSDPDDAQVNETTVAEESDAASTTTSPPVVRPAPKVIELTNTMGLNLNEWKTKPPTTSAKKRGRKAKGKKETLGKKSSTTLSVSTAERRIPPPRKRGRPKKLAEESEDDCDFIVEDDELENDDDDDYVDDEGPVKKRNRKSAAAEEEEEEDDLLVEDENDDDDIEEEKPEPPKMVTIKFGARPLPPGVKPLSRPPPVCSPPAPNELLENILEGDEDHVDSQEEAENHLETSSGILDDLDYGHDEDDLEHQPETQTIQVQQDPPLVPVQELQHQRIILQSTAQARDPSEQMLLDSKSVPTMSTELGCVIARARANPNLVPQASIVRVPSKSGTGTVPVIQLQWKRQDVVQVQGVQTAAGTTVTLGPDPPQRFRPLIRPQQIPSYTATIIQKKPPPGVRSSERAHERLERSAAFEPQLSPTSGLIIEQNDGAIAAATADPHDEEEDIISIQESDLLGGTTTVLVDQSGEEGGGSLSKAQEDDNDEDFLLLMSEEERKPVRGGKKRKTCWECKKTFSSATLLTEHENIVHLGIADKVCTYEGCDFKTARHTTMEMHVKKNHLKWPDYKCSYDGCLFTAYQLKTVNNHINKVHLQVKPFSCDQCGKMFLNMDTLTKHVKLVHRRERNYPCPHCEYRGAKRIDVEGHVNSKHTGEKPYLCQEPDCEFAAAIKGTLTAHHKKVHQNIPVIKRIHHCSYDGCNYSSDNTTNVRAHVNAVHLKLKPFKCELCTFATTTKTSLGRHIKVVHQGYRPHCCDQCNYSTARKHHLDEHIQNVHVKSLDVQCELCDYRTSTKQRLDKHLKATHMGTGAPRPKSNKI